MTPAGSDWRDLYLGQKREPLREGPITVNDFVVYQGASGDLNPIHHDAEFAAAAGFPGPFAVGMRQAGILGTYVERWFGRSAIRGFRVRFREQAWPGDVLVYRGVVVACRESDGQRIVELELEVAREGGGVHLVGAASVVVPADPPGGPDE